MSMHREAVRGGAGSLATPSRRVFLKALGGAAGALCIGIGFTDDADAATDAASVATLNLFLRIGADDSVIVVSPVAEMGQNASASLAMALADELDCDWKNVTIEFAPANIAYKGLYGVQLTGGSSSVRFFWEPMATAGAAARQMLLGAAARRWNVAAGELSAGDGVVLHKATGRTLRYGELAAEAATIALPEKPKLKALAERKLIGKRVRRLDTFSKVTGRAVYAMDVQLPGLLVASIALPPVHGSRLKGFDAAKALAVPGVQEVLPFSNGVAVLAKDFWTAKKGRDALVESIQWDLGEMAGLNSDTLRDQMKKAADQPGVSAAPVGDAAAVLGAPGAKVIEADYNVPYLAHACMEPLNTTAWVKPDSVEIWSGSQHQTRHAEVCAKFGGVKPENVTVHTTLLGGGFGRKLAWDFVQYAVEVSKAAQGPVRLVFTREDDMRSHHYRPAQFARMRAVLGSDGTIQAMNARLVSSSIRIPTGGRLTPEGLDTGAIEGMHGNVYELPNFAVQWVRHEPGPVIWPWRSVGHSHNGFVNECFIDELAAAAGQDPLAFRLAHLKGKPRHSAVLRAAADRAGWGTALPAGRARGIAIHECFGSIAAQVAEVSIEDGKIRVHRMTAAVDAGRFLNPAGAEAQTESCVATGMSQALLMKISFKDGRVEQSNFHDFPVLRFAQMPKVDVVLLESGANPGGLGEPPTPPVAPAIANALARLTGQRQRELPLRV